MAEPIVGAKAPDKVEKKPHCAMCQSPDTLFNGPWVICKKCGFKRKIAKC